MNTITVQEIQQDPQGVFRRVEAGERLVVVRNEKAVAEVRPLPAEPLIPRPFGLCKGKVVISPDFDAPLPEAILTDFEQP